VAGTSLKVFPFAALIEVVPAKVPIILINREDSLEKCANPSRKFLGDIDEIIGDLAKALDWHL
jgi:NAD-dependent SIR2 family protein deacetylase